MRAALFFTSLLKIVKEAFDTPMSIAELAEKYNIDKTVIYRWVSKYRNSNFDDSVFNKKRGRKASFITDPSKIPPVLLKELGLDEVIDTNDPDKLKTQIEQAKLEIAQLKLENKILRELLGKKSTE